MGNLTKNKPKLRLVGKLSETKKNSRKIKNKNKETNPKKQAQNEQIHTKTRPSFVLQQIETAKMP